MNTLPTAADVILAQAQAAQANTASNAAKPKSKYWINLYRKGSRAPVDQVGGFPIDHMPDYVEACKSSEAFVTNAFSTPLVDAYFAETGVSSKTPIAQDLSAFM